MDSSLGGLVRALKYSESHHFKCFNKQVSRRALEGVGMGRDKHCIFGPSA